MELRKIGSLEVSVVGLGTNNFGGLIDEERSRAVVDACLGAGINFFDCADVYGRTESERILGRALKGRRGEAVIATKFGSRVDDERPGGARPDYVRRAADDSLARLGVDEIDLYILHRPDPSTPIAETLGALGELVAAGKVREIGCSNFSVEQLEDAAAASAADSGGARFVNLQNDYSLLNRSVEAEILPACARLGVAFVPYFPLAAGLLTGKFRRGAPLPEGTRIAGMAEDRRSRFYNERNLDVVEALTTFVESRGHGVLDAAVSFLLTQPAVTSVIAGATSPEQVQANAAAAEWKLDEEELATIDEITRA